MNRASLFNSPLLLGFDQLERAIDRISRHSGDGYPPYNVEQLGESRLRITLAVAGFSDQDLQVQVENNQLTIRGKQTEGSEKIYLYRGIAARQFQRSFMLADGIEVTSAKLDNGMLQVDLQRPIEATKVRTVKIQAGSQAAGENLAQS